MTVNVVPHNPDWGQAFAAEAQAITSALGPEGITLHHIGSTSIKGILAKPIIDLLGVVPSLDDLDSKTHMAERLGYEAMGAFGIEGRRYFRKFNAVKERTHHLHVFADGSAHIERHLAFRDYLRRHPKVAGEYSDLKASLTAGTAATWDGYMDGKDPFIKRVERDAVDWFRTQKKT